MLNQLMDGVVVDTNDPQQMGRIKVMVPAIDGDLYKIECLPWATYLSPMAGQTRNYPAGPNGAKTDGLMSYGWWSIPKNGALVVVGFLYGDVNRRVYLGSYFREHGNRSAPVGRNRSDLSATPVSDTFDPVEPQTTNLNAQFQGQFSRSEAITRGAYERSIAQDKTEKDGTQGYQTNLIEPTGTDSNGKTIPMYESQTHVLSTPGRHAIIFQDNPDNGRVRIKTAAGHQIILDDANERVYISTAKGKSYLELDQDGRVHVYSEDDISMTAKNDFNLTVGGNFNLVAGKDVNIQANGDMKLAACKTANLSGAGINLDSSAEFNILASADLIQTGASIHLNGPGASPAECPVVPSVVPTHEPWERPASKGSRNSKWRP